MSVSVSTTNPVATSTLMKYKKIHYKDWLFYFFRTSMDNDGASLELVHRFCYLGNILSIDGDR